MVGRHAPRAALALFAAFATLAVAGSAGAASSGTTTASDGPRTPIEHVVVIFQENVSFDHYFGRARGGPLGVTPLDRGARPGDRRALVSSLQ